MSGTNCGCGCGGGCGHQHCCETFPPEFVRMRYFFGQRLGVVDFSDEQSYVVGKQRFHNRALHGAGVVCGLRAERFVFPQNSPPDTPTTVIRLSRGAAIDACGREIIVGADQCIDVNAWFGANRTRPELAAIPLPATLRICIGLRYRDCPADPAPAPRDPCGCDSGGCEFGRIRESYHLSLLTESEQADCHFTLSPSLEDLEHEHALVLASSPLSIPSAATLLTAAHRAVASGCHDASDATWLCLACLDVAIDAGGLVTDITSVDNFGEDRRTLLPTHLLQDLLLSAASLNSAAGAGGPILGAITFAGTSLTAGQFRIPVRLGTSGTPAVPTPIAEATLQPSFVQLLRFEDSPMQWSTVAQSNFDYDDTVDPPLIRADYNTLVAGARYRLVFESPIGQPAVDQRMRPVTPAVATTQVRLIDESGTLVATSALF